MPLRGTAYIPALKDGVYAVFLIKKAESSLHSGVLSAFHTCSYGASGGTGVDSS